MTETLVSQKNKVCLEGEQLEIDMKRWVSEVNLRNQRHPGRLKLRKDYTELLHVFSQRSFANSLSKLCISPPGCYRSISIQDSQHPGDHLDHSERHSWSSFWNYPDDYQNRFNLTRATVFGSPQKEEDYTTNQPSLRGCKSCFQRLYELGYPHPP